MDITPEGMVLAASALAAAAVALALAWARPYWDALTARDVRYSDITTTARHYAQHKARITVGLGKLLDTGIKPVAAGAVNG